MNVHVVTWCNYVHAVCTSREQVETYAASRWPDASGFGVKIEEWVPGTGWSPELSQRVPLPTDRPSPWSDRKSGKS